MEEALQLWRGSAYKGINAKLLQEKVGDAVAKRYLGTSRIPANVDAILRELRNGMRPLEVLKPYYRGCSKLFEKNCHLETFVSISKNKEDAEAFADKGGNVYSITLAKGVKGLGTGVEGETLLEDGCYWEYHGANTVTIHPPSANKDYGWCSASEQKPVVMCHSLTLTDEEEEFFQQFKGGRPHRKTRRRKMTRKYCKKTPCRKMGFTQKASCRPYKNCYRNKK